MNRSRKRSRLAGVRARRRTDHDASSHVLSWSPFFAAIGFVVTGTVGAADVGPPAQAPKPANAETISIRTESYARPPYSGATYYLYEREGTVICTKLEVCNKYDVCETSYFEGRHRADEDVRAGEPYGRTEAVPIARDKLGRHRCLARFRLGGGS